MAMACQTYAALFEYPEGAGHERLALALAALPDPRGALEPLAESVRNRPAVELEELYTRTFDINPVCTLEVGWHIFGEDYNRGALLVHLRGLLREHGLDEGGELPDHLATVLRLLDRLPRSDAGTLARRYVLPAVGKMTGGLADEENPYRGVLTELEHVLRDEFGEAEPPLERAHPYDCAATCAASGPRGD